MAEKKTGASYLDRPLFTFSRENLSAGTPLILAGLIVSGIGLVFAALVILYLLMAFPRDWASNEPSANQPSVSKSAEVNSYAVNILSEEELTTLPLNKTLSRLSVKGGQDGKDTNAPPAPKSL